jgi:hypothetical protein
MGGRWTSLVRADQVMPIQGNFMFMFQVMSCDGYLQVDVVGEGGDGDVGIQHDRIQIHLTDVHHAQPVLCTDGRQQPARE